MVNLIQDTSVSEEEMYEGFKRKCKAVFVADGVRYELTGYVEPETMKEIVDGLHY